MTSEKDTTSARVEAIDWFHSFEIVPGVRSSGVYDPSLHVSRAEFPASYAGRSVLDIGSWDGYYAFEAERRGAARVLATDSWAWQGRSPLPLRPGDPTPRFGSKRGFDLVRELRGSAVESAEIDVMDLSPERVGTFDIVQFLGVLYHLPHPNLALERVASVCDDLLILETQTDLMMLRRPAAAFYAAGELRGDTSNWWGPNLAALIGMVRAAGFSSVRVTWSPGPLHRVASWARRIRSDERPTFWSALNQGRAMLHARRN